MVDVLDDHLLCQVLAGRHGLGGNDVPDDRRNLWPQVKCIFWKYLSGS